MGKPFDKELANWSREREKRLVEKLNSIFKKLKAELGPGEDHNIEIRLDNRLVAIMEVEVVPKNRWEKIITKYPTVRWPIAKKKYADDDYLRKKFGYEKVFPFMVSIEENLTNIAIIDAYSWVREGKEEKERVVRAGAKRLIYRKGQEEPFWSIQKGKIRLGFKGLEDYLLIKISSF